MPDGAIYWFGNECTSVTGGWTHDDYDWWGDHSMYDKPGTKGTNYMRFYTETTPYFQGLGTANLIDITPYNTIKTLVSDYTASNSAGYLAKTKVQIHAQADKVGLYVAADDVHSADISSKTGGYYAFYKTQNGGGYSVKFVVLE